jgi:xylulokinase
LEGVAFNTRWLLESVELFSKHHFDSLNMIGGGAQADIWCQIMADVLNCQIRKVKDPILANSRGAAYVAAVALGYMTFEDIHERVPIERIFTPEKTNRDIYDELYSEFLNIYKRNQPIYARLNRNIEHK